MDKFTINKATVSMKINGEKIGKDVEHDYSNVSNDKTVKRYGIYVKSDGHELEFSNRFKYCGYDTEEEAEHALLNALDRDEYTAYQRDYLIIPFYRKERVFLRMNNEANNE
jgi:hypothetical protein